MPNRKCKYDVALIGGDARVSFAGEYLTEKGYQVIGFGLTKVENCREVTQCESIKDAIEEVACIVGGVPMFREGKLNGHSLSTTISEEAFYKMIEPKQIVVGGMIPKSLEILCKDKMVGCYDYMKDESMTVYNAIATAEGTIMEAIRLKNTNLYESKCLVLGFGNCGKILAKKLKGIGARVSVCARNEVARAWAYAEGCETFSFAALGKQVGTYEYIFNTVPALVVDEEILSQVRKDVLIVDIASGRGGIDYDYAREHEVRAVQCLGIPGRCAAKTSGRIIAQYVERVMSGDVFERSLKWD